ncbi:MAG: hypothetical protein GKC04_06430 [Methanomicrobiales archaeon]|nr:hypothetical protein [Methanomicrobiales archaeon]
MKRNIAFLCLLGMSLLITAANAGTVQPDWVGPNIPLNPTDGHYGFEDGVDGQVVASNVAGVVFTTTMGYDWIYADIRTGGYNMRYPLVGNFCTWLGVSGDEGRIDFTDGTATYFSALVSTPSYIQLDAYDENGVLVDSATFSGSNLDTGKMIRLTVQAPAIAYVMMHDSGNYWIMDEICTDAPGVESDGTPVPEFPSFAVSVCAIVGMLLTVMIVKRRES